MDKLDLVPFFNESLFVPALQAKSKEGVLEELVTCFVNSGFVRNPAIVLEMIHRREQLGSTGIGHGLAIPHGRSTAAPELMIAFGCSKKGIEWEAMDGEPVHLVFMVIAPPQEQDNKYLPVLGRLVEILSHSRDRDKFRNVNSFSDFIKLLKN
ncbi:MAG: PTS system fructose-specific EIIABC component [bacterium]|nr:PTS system fructose-specific EIIABC component [bacterium]MCK6560344.1 PTS sugar transporter subunit IIA [bacterium]NUM64189.1 PTS sugar transporter subunit IIA [candidate division KSB1 bacterium]